MKKLICAILLIASVVMMGCSAKTDDIRRVTNSTNPVCSVTPESPINNGSENSKPNTATADVNGYKRLNLTSIIVKVDGINDANFYNSAKPKILSFNLKASENGESATKVVYANFDRYNSNYIFVTDNNVSGSIKLDDDQSLLYSNIYFDGSCGSKNYLLNETIVAQIEKLSDTKAQANFRLVLESNVFIMVMCEFCIEFVESL